MDENKEADVTPPGSSLALMPLPKRYGLFGVLALMQILLVARVAWQADWSWLQFFNTAAISAFSVVVFFLLWYSALSQLRYRWTGTVTKAVIAIYALLLVYHWLRLEPLSFLIVYKNGADLLTWEAVDYLLSNASVVGWVALLTAVFVVIWLFRRYEMVGSPLRHPAKVPALIVLLLLNIVSVAAFSSSRNEIVEFSASVYRYFQYDDTGWNDHEPYPYLKKSDGANDYFDADFAPNVFVVMLESFSAEYIDKVENGQPVTPFFNRLKDEGLYVNNFFSASVETSKGQFATLCSVYPSYRTNVFTSYPDNNFHCLSHILQERGYTTVFMKAFHSLGFENTGDFVAANGFEYAHGMDGKFVTPQERKQYKIGWGIRDDIFYRKTFDYLDSLEKSNRDNPKQKSPFFVTTMSVTNHMMFDDIPPEHRYIHANPQSHQDNYANSMYLTDQYLKVFFEELNKRDYLKNSVVVVLGDNGFPMGQHNNYHNTKTVYNELFKTPLLVWWPGHVKPKAVTNTARSQLDVAPTVTDLLDIDTNHHFVGDSVLRAPADDYFVPLIQPFDGTYLASLRYPYKYVKHLKTGKESLFDLRQDPQERTDLMAERESPDTPLPWGVPLASLRHDVQVLKRNEALLKEDRIYPSGERDNVRVVFTTNRIGEGQPLIYRVLGDTDGVSVAITIEPYVKAKGTTFLADVSRSDAEVFAVAAERFEPGVSRVSFEVYVDDELSSTTSGDVFVSTEEVRLLSDLGAQGQQDWGSLHTNRSVRGGPLRVAGNSYGFGLGTHASSDYRVNLDRDYEMLYIAFGLDDESACGNGAKFRVFADGEAIYISERIKSGEFDSALLNVAGHSHLRLSTRNLGNGACDHTNWINPVLFRQNPAAL
jgi:phosphoglycerol transferase MdoB-like AlkP superfamily enzyme